MLKQSGTENIVVCAGARNAPLVLTLQKMQDFKIYNFFEERSAAFFALGLIKSTGRPVAVLTTSGTAVAELLPATIEARYQGLPLILITADRPKSYRGTGSPQTIDQVGIFTDNVESVYDLDVHSKDFTFAWSLKKPLHVNVSFDEPLIDQSRGGTPTAKLKITGNQQKPSEKKPDFKRPLIILGEIAPDDRNQVIEFITNCGAPVYAESLSQLRDFSIGSTQVLRSSELVKKIFKMKWCDSVIRIGGVPTLRFWRDLENEFSNIPVINFSSQSWTGLSRKSVLAEMADLRKESEFDCGNLTEMVKLAKVLEKEKERLFAKYPISEQSLTKEVSGKIHGAPIYIGNSLPIRNWDEFAVASSGRIYANRGANGIDGQISTYLGWSENDPRSFCYVGDLTAMYDLASLGLSPQLHKNQRNLIIMNNFGGQIFNRVFNNDNFINAHDTQFFHWAKMWNWNYIRISEPQALNHLATEQAIFTVYELLPDNEQTKKFWCEWDTACQQL